jgi:hypothetical protein
MLVKWRASHNKLISKLGGDYVKLGGYMLNLIVGFFVGVRYRLVPVKIKRRGYEGVSKRVS